jgi:hypothetical protein
LRNLLNKKIPLQEERDKINSGTELSYCAKPDSSREALGNYREQSSPRPYLFRLIGFDADRRLFSLFPPIFRLIRASMG